MTQRLLPLALALTLALGACNRTEPVDNAAAPEAPVAPAEPVAPTPPAPPMRLRGQALMGKDGYGLVACGNTEQQVVAFEAGAQAALDQFLQGGAKEFFVDGWATMGDDGRARFDRIERLYTEGPGCDEKDLSLLLYQARGNEPFWSLAVKPEGLTLERPDVPAVQLPYQPFVVTGETRRYEGDNAGTKVIVELAPGTCSDGMSDTVYGHNATVTIGTETLKGCAYSGLVSE